MHKEAFRRRSVLLTMKIWKQSKITKYILEYYVALYWMDGSSRHIVEQKKEIRIPKNVLFMKIENK